MIATVQTCLHIFGVLEDAALPDLVAALPSFGLPFDAIDHFRSGKTAAHGDVRTHQEAIDDLARVADLGLCGDLMMWTVPGTPGEPTHALLYDAPRQRLVRGTRDAGGGAFQPSNPDGSDIARNWPDYADILDGKGRAHLEIVASRHALAAAARDPDLYPGAAMARMRALAGPPQPG